MRCIADSWGGSEATERSSTGITVRRWQAFLLPWRPLWCRTMVTSSATTSVSALAARRKILRAEFAATAKLALPMALTQLGQIAMMTTDLALIGRLGEGAL